MVNCKPSVKNATEQKQRKRTRYVKLNAVKCLKCHRILVSVHRHDFIQCDCKENPIFIDGGTELLGGGWYWRNGGDPRQSVGVPIYWRID